MPRFLIFLMVLMLVYFAATSLFRILFPYLMKRFINKGREQYNAAYRQEKEGTVTVKGNKKNKRIDDDKGDYVNYEEVE